MEESGEISEQSPPEQAAPVLLPVLVMLYIVLAFLIVPVFCRSLLRWQQWEISIAVCWASFAFLTAKLSYSGFEYPMPAFPTVKTGLRDITVTDPYSIVGGAMKNPPPVVDPHGCGCLLLPLFYLFSPITVLVILPLIVIQCIVMYPVNLVVQSTLYLTKYALHVVFRREDLEVDGLTSWRRGAKWASYFCIPPALAVWLLHLSTYFDPYTFFHPR